MERLAEEMLHHISNEIAGRRYSEKSVTREHYWMKSYEDFPEKLDIALLRLKDEYLVKLKEARLPATGLGSRLYSRCYLNGHDERVKSPG